MAKATTPKRPNSSTSALGFEATLWATADKLRGNLDAAEYKHVVLGLIFLKYISDAFEEKHAELQKEKGADPEDRDEYTADNIFWVPPEARWSYLQGRAKDPVIGKLLDSAMIAIERDNPSLKGVLPKEYARPIWTSKASAASLTSSPPSGWATRRAVPRTSSGASMNIFSANSPAPKARKAGNSTRPAASSNSSSKCSPRTKAASSTRAAVRAACSCNRLNS